MISNIISWSFKEYMYILIYQHVPWMEVLSLINYIKDLTMKKKLQPLNDEIKVYQSLPLLLVCCELLSSVDQEDTYFDPNGRVTGKIALRAPEVRKTVSASLITKRPIVWPCSNSSTYNDWSQVFDLIFFYEQFFVVNRGFYFVTCRV